MFLYRSFWKKHRLTNNFPQKRGLSVQKVLFDVVLFENYSTIVFMERGGREYEEPLKLITISS